MKRECMYAWTDYDLLIMYKCVNFCEMNIHSFILSIKPNNHLMPVSFYSIVPLIKLKKKVYRNLNWQE